jgi:hypothetical protein
VSPPPTPSETAQLPLLATKCPDRGMMYPSMCNLNARENLWIPSCTMLVFPVQSQCV